MGLSQGEEKRPGTSPLRAWLLPAAIAVVALLLLLAGEPASEIFRFDRAAIAAGEVWRLLTGHFVHLGPSHALLNIAGLLLVWFLVGQELGNSTWLLVLGASIAAVDVGLWFFVPTLNWYVGLSGLLHGLLTAGVVAAFAERRLEAAIIVLVVAGKILIEQTTGPLPGSESTSGGKVVVDAHLYGAIGGVLVAMLLIRVRRNTPI